MKAKSSRLLLILVSLLMLASRSSAMLICSQPSPASLLASLQSVFELNSIRPVVNISTPTNVSISFTLYGILGVDEKAQVLKTFIWQSLVWENEFTKWNSEECGVEWIAVPRKLLWVPDIVINEFMEKNSAPDVPYTYLHFKGGVFDQQPVRVVSSCHLDIYLFPFDTQNCTFTFNSYIHTLRAIKLDSLSPAEQVYQISKLAMATMGEWELIGIKSELKEIPTLEGDTYEELHFYISVRRHPIMYVANLLIPSCFLITVDLFSFGLPVQDVDRSLFKMTLILGYTVFLLSTNNLLPITGNTIPLINVFLSLCLCMMVTSLLETIFIANLLLGSAHYNPPPHWIRMLVLQILGRLVRLPPKPSQLEDTVIQNPDAQEMKDLPQTAKESETSEQKEPLNEDETVQVLQNLGSDLQAIHLQIVQQLKGNPSSEEWVQVGFIIDRLLFILYTVFITVSFITIIIIWVMSYNTT